jgi:UPF0176 protein
VYHHRASYDKRRDLCQGVLEKEGARVSSSMNTTDVLVSAFYYFTRIEPERLTDIRQQFEGVAENTGLRGLVVMGGEGINATIAGTTEAVRAFHDLMRHIFPAADYTPKDSRAEKMPFSRFKVDVRPEIITTKDLSISSEGSHGTHLTPREWHEMIANDPDVVLVDTRNDYETEVGVFEGAIDPKIKKFSDFQRFVEDQGLPKDKKLFLYCTGGIRCEKAVPEVKRLGYDKVYQLEGGILRYLEEYPDGFFKGECFVFDHRVAVDSHLQPSKTYKLCPHCGNPAKEAIACVKCGKDAVVCHRCVERVDRKTCSKNCAHHTRLHLEKSPPAPSTSERGS